jgi:transcriptional regulator with XRE-family HTH domain
VLAGPATTGSGDLDRALGGLYWGDNVVFEVRREGQELPFFAALAAEKGQSSAIARVALDDRESVEAPLIDGRPGAHDRPGALLQAVRVFGRANERSVLLFDPLDAMVHRWGAETTLRFFARCCPLLLDLGALAYWSVSLSPDLAGLRAGVVDITQCVLALEDHRLRVVKADGRSPGVEGSVYAYLGGTSLRIAPATSRLAAALKSVREARGLSQTELARVAGVSPSAISHAERGQSGLSLDTLVDLAGRLGVSLDDLLRGSDGPGYRLARRLDPAERSAGGAMPLLDDPGTGLRLILVRLARGESGSPPLVHKGVESVAVASGLVQIRLGERHAALRTGEALVAERAPISGWRNLGDGEATLFWILRD